MNSLMTRASVVAFAAVAFGASGVEAQTGTIAGTLMSSGARPVSGASIMTRPETRTAQSGADGRFVLDGIPVGAYELVIRAVGYRPILERVTVLAGETARMSARLVESAQGIAVAVVEAEADPGSMRPLPDISGTLILAGAKSELIEVKGMNINLSEKTGRQMFAKVPGVFVYDMDGSGNQVNVSARGLDSHRSWEFNVRQDGVVINSDLYGYPASHYSPPGEAIERIELVRGTAALQYGSQFGGLLNYITRRPDTTRRVAFESINTAGAFGLRSTYNSLGGKVNGLTYRAYASVRHSDGFRDNSTSDYEAQYVAAEGELSPSVRVRAQFGRSRYRYQIPGPLTDAMFNANPSQSTRARNYFSPDIKIPSLRLDWEPSEATKLSFQASAVLGDRSSVQFVGFADVPDVPNPGTGLYGTRAVDIDNFRSYMGEARLTHETRVAGMDAIIAAGLMLADNDLRRRQQGVGSRDADYDLTITGEFGRDLHYLSKGLSGYVETALRPVPQWSIIPGVRVESGTTDMTGRLAYYDPAKVARTVRHNFPLFGVRSEYKLTSGRELYGGWSQSYRPMLLKDVLPENALERTDESLKDARGWTLEGGMRGALGTRVTFDATAFLMRYNNRFGALLQTDPSTGSSYLFKTNVGSADTKGAEVAVDLLAWYRGSMSLRAFTATSYFDARYRRGSVVISNVNTSIVGNEVESAPKWISRNGVTLRGARASVSATVSHVSRSFADPQNTVAPTANGARGIVPAYTVLDFGGSAQVLDWMSLKVAVSNALDAAYFTKRPAFYPGPGVWPSDGRGVQLTATLTP